MINTNNQQNIILAAIETSTNDLWDLDDQFLAESFQSQLHLLANHDSDLIDSDYSIH